MTLRIFGFAIILFGSLSVSAQAQFVNFYFTVPNETGNDPENAGNVTGEIFGLVDNGLPSTPTDIVIDSVPGASMYGITTPYSLASNGWDLSGGGTYSFTVSGGAVTADTNFLALSSDSKLIVLFNSSGQQNGFGFAYSADATYNSSGFSGATYTIVPEPFQYGFILVLAFAGLIAWRKLSLSSKMDTDVHRHQLT